MGTFKVSKLEDKKPAWAKKLMRGSDKGDCYACGGAIKKAVGGAIDDSGAQDRPPLGNAPMHSRGATGAMKMGGMMGTDDAIPTKKMPARNKAIENKGMTEKFARGGMTQFEKASSPSKEPKQGQFSKKEKDTGYSGPGQFDRAEANPKSFKHGGHCDKRAMGGVGKIKQGIIKE